VNDGNIRDAAQRTSESGFAGAPRADHCYTLHPTNVVSVVRFDLRTTRGLLSLEEITRRPARIY
jgi:hypothetical protein